MIRAIFFDFDGTILDTRKLAEDALVLTLDELELEYDRVEAFGLLGVKMRLILVKLGLEAEKIEDGRKLFYKHYSDEMLRSGAEPCVSLEPLYEMMNDYTLIVVSNSDMGFLKAAIEKMEIGDLFEGVYGAEVGKSKDDVLKRVLGERGFMAEEGVYVGDRFSDVNFGKKARMKTVAVSNACSWSTRDELEKERPDFVVEDFVGLGKVIGKL